MKPYPLSALNHFTVPDAIDETPPLLLENGQKRRKCASDTRSDSLLSVAPFSASWNPEHAGATRTGPRRGRQRAAVPAGSGSHHEERGAAVVALGAMLVKTGDLLTDGALQLM